MTTDEKKMFQNGFTVGMQLNNRLASPYGIAGFVNWLNPNTSWKEEVMDKYKEGYNKIMIVYACCTNPMISNQFKVLLSKTDYEMGQNILWEGTEYHRYVFSEDYYYASCTLNNGNYTAPSSNNKFHFEKFNHGTSSSGVPYPPLDETNYIGEVWSNCGWGKPLPFAIDEEGNVTSYKADTNFLNGISVAMAVNYLPTGEPDYTIYAEKVIHRVYGSEPFSSITTWNIKIYGTGQEKICLYNQSNASESGEQTLYTIRSNNTNYYKITGIRTKKNSDGYEENEDITYPFYSISHGTTAGYYAVDSFTINTNLPIFDTKEEVDEYLNS